MPPEDIVYAGIARCCAGLYQLVFRVPPNVRDGDPAGDRNCGGGRDAGAVVHYRRESMTSLRQESKSECDDLCREKFFGFIESLSVVLCEAYFQGISVRGGA